MEAEPVMEAVEKMLGLVDRLRAQSIPIRHLDLGRRPRRRLSPGRPDAAIGDFIRKVRANLEGKDLVLMVEPGRSIVGEAGALLTRVLYRKQTARKEFVVVDAAMNDLIRPSLYQSRHEIIPLKKSSRGTIVADVVGPVCETTDFLARDREVDNVLPGDLLAVSPPAPTALSWPPTTTPARAPRSSGRGRHVAHHPRPGEARRPDPRGAKIG